MGCDPDYPRMPFTPKIYAGVPEYDQICRKIKKPYTAVPDPCYEYSPFNDEYDKECVSADCTSFKGYQCLPNDDLAGIQKYIVTLIKKCKSWEK